MPLNFPNTSRSYNETRHSVRFTGYDGINQIIFFLASDGLHSLDSRAGLNEKSALAVFDKNVSRILAAAAKAYRGTRPNTYYLGAAAVS